MRFDAIDWSKPAPLWKIDAPLSEYGIHMEKITIFGDRTDTIIQLWAPRGETISVETIYRGALGLIINISAGSHYLGMVDCR